MKVSNVYYIKKYRTRLNHFSQHGIQIKSTTSEPVSCAIWWRLLAAPKNKQTKKNVIFTTKQQFQLFSINK